MRGELLYGLLGQGLQHQVAPGEEKWGGAKQHMWCEWHLSGHDCYRHLVTGALRDGSQDMHIVCSIANCGMHVKGGGGG